MTGHHTQVRVENGCRDSPVACLYSLLREQRHEFKTRRWSTPNGLNLTTEHTVTTPRGQPPLVTSTFASCPLRDSGPPRPRSRVEDTNNPPARRCSCKLRPTRKVGGESPMAQWIRSAVRSGPWMLSLARRPISVAAAQGCDAALLRIRPQGESRILGRRRLCSRRPRRRLCSNPLS